MSDHRTLDAPTPLDGDAVVAVLTALTESVENLTTAVEALAGKQSRADLTLGELVNVAQQLGTKVNEVGEMVAEVKAGGLKSILMGRRGE